MQKISKQEKSMINAGASAYSGTWVKCIGFSLVANTIANIGKSIFDTINNTYNPNASQNQNSIYESDNETYIRVSPIPSRTSIGFWV